MSDPTLLPAALLLFGLGAFAAGLTGVLFGRARPLPVRSRRQGLGVLCAGVVLMAVGTTMSPAPAETTTARTPTPARTPTTAATTTTAATIGPTPGTTTAAGPAEATRALAAVEQLVVKGRGPKTGYERELFGQTWFDADRNGCDTRNDILRRDLTAALMKNACKVISGSLSPDPYTGTTIGFVLGGASEVDIDHLVAVSDAWQKGAAQWTAGKRLAFANDPLNLLAVDAHTNRSKGDGDTATWLPPNKPFRCAYVARQVAVKLKYQLSVTPAEKMAMNRVLNGCPTAELPPPGPAPTVATLPRTR